MTTDKELTVEKAGENAAPRTARGVKESADASGIVAGAGKPVQLESPKLPGRAAARTLRGAETTVRAAAAGRVAGIAYPHVQIADSKGASSASVMAGDTKAASGKDPKNGPSVRPEIEPASAGEAVTSSQRFSIRTQGGADSATLRTPTRDVGEQILDSIHASLARGDRQITIRLRPPELGTVLVRLREQGEHLSGLLEVGKNDVRREIEQALPQVLRSLQEAGIQIRRFEVLDPDQPQKDPAREQMQQDVWSQQHGSGHSRDPLQTSAPTRWSQDDAGHPAGSQEEPSVHQPNAPAPGRINLLL